STAEAIAVMVGGLSQCHFFGNGTLAPEDLGANLLGAIIKDPVQDRVVWLEYLKTVVKEREGWKDLYRACMEVL
ncbi:MAG: ATPase, partial [Cystobacter sp.]